MLYTLWVWVCKVYNTVVKGHYVVVCNVTYRSPYPPPSSLQVTFKYANSSIRLGKDQVPQHEG